MMMVCAACSAAVWESEDVGAVKLNTLITLGLAAMTLVAWTPRSLGSVRPVFQANPPAPQRSVSITDVHVVPPPSEGDPYRVEATLHAGSRVPVNLTFRLRSQRSGEIAADQVSTRVTVEPGSAMVLVAEIQASPDDYAPEIVAEY
jgi:hypothetical protein